MTKPLLKKFYFMSPVQVVKVTTHNIEQATEWCGGKIKTTDSRRNPGRTDKYIDVPVPKGAALVMAFPGMYITKRVVISLENEIKVTFGVFRRDYFEKNYFSDPLESVDACWTRLANEEIKPEIVAGTNQTTTVMNIHVASPGDVGKALEAARQKVLEGSDKPDVEIINLIAGDPTVSEPQFSDSEIPLTPYQQRALITEDHVEEGTVPETANVVLPSYAAAKHPSLREQAIQVGKEIREADALIMEELGGVLVEEKFHVDTDNQIVSGDTEHQVINEFDDAFPELEEETPTTQMQEALANAVEKIDAESGAAWAGLVEVPATAPSRQQQIEDGDPHR